MNRYDEHEFRQRVAAALQRIKTILEHTRHPQPAEEVSHTYEDKYALAEFLTRAAVASLFQCLEFMGLTAEGQARLHEWAQRQSVSLRFKAQEDCTFLREETRTVESTQERVVETRSFFGRKTTRTEKVVTTITEYVWRFDCSYELFAFRGAEETNNVPLLARRASIEIKTAAKNTPRPRTVVRPVLDVNATWLFARAANTEQTFSIDRTKSTCHTPRRNDDIEAALHTLSALFDWCTRVRSYFLDELFPVQSGHGLELSALQDNELFVPVVPLFDPKQEGSLVLFATLEEFLEEQKRSLDRKSKDLAVVFPNNTTVLTVAEASAVVLLLHLRQLCQHYSDGVEHIENLLRKQLIAAIGKELTAEDFGHYMEFHSRKLFNPAYAPLPFSHAVRRPEHDPEGVVSIEAVRGASMATPVSMLMARSEAQRPMSFALDASTRVSFAGERCVHAWVSYQFSGAADFSLRLAAQARQFSSFVLLLGRIVSAEVFEPKFAIVVQNKDLLEIPLLLEQIPTPKEFRDAIASLSPEQQRFAKAFRSMQLESTLFGVCVLQIKPQLEKLLKLPSDSLTKEIKLTQELLQLFLDYQIPSDLLSYDGPQDASVDEKLQRVKTHVAHMMEMIDASKRKQIEEAREREARRLAEESRTPTTHAMPVQEQARDGKVLTGRRRAAAEMSPTAQRTPATTTAPVKTPPVSKDAVTTRSEAVEPATTSSAHASAKEFSSVSETEDYTKIPMELEKKFENDSAVRPTIINPGEQWSRRSQAGLLGAPTHSTLRANEQKTEKNKAFDLLDALTKAGALSIDHASLHVVLAATHCFDRSLLDTVIQENRNPIEQFERSLLQVATTIFRQPATQLLVEEQQQRFFTYTPELSSE